MLIGLFFYKNLMLINYLFENLCKYILNAENLFLLCKIIQKESMSILYLRENFIFYYHIDDHTSFNQNNKSDNKKKNKFLGSFF